MPRETATPSAPPPPAGYPRPGPGGIIRMPYTPREAPPDPLAGLLRDLIRARRGWLDYYGSPARPVASADPRGYFEWSRGLKPHQDAWWGAADAARRPVRDWAGTRAAWVAAGREAPSWFEGATYAVWERWYWDLDGVRFTYDHAAEALSYDVKPSALDALEAARAR